MEFLTKLHCILDVFWLQAKKISDQVSRRGLLSRAPVAPDGGGAQMRQVKETVEGEEAASSGSSDSARYHTPTVAPVYSNSPPDSIPKKAATYEQEDWPQQEECTAVTSPVYFPPVFLPPENKGFE